MNGVMDRIRRLAAHPPRRLVLAEGDDERVARAADRLARERMAQVTLLGPREAVRAAARKAEVALTGVRVLDSEEAGLREATFRSLREARAEKLTEADARRWAGHPLMQAGHLVRAGEADCFVGGAANATADVLRAALWLVGLKPGTRLVSSFFVMVLPGAGGGERVFFFADCGVVPDPDADQLAEIGVTTADSFTRLTQQVPHVAFLSFSTKGSADHPHVRKVRDAVERARRMRPELHLDGELQLDAAVDPGVARKKAPDSPVAGHANVLIFPDLDAGNIGYKLTQRLAGARAYGPILQGLARQANDLSRGCSADDVAEVSTIACALAVAARPEAL
jgi:phosphate acetyltransferase